MLRSKLSRIKFLKNNFEFLNLCLTIQGQMYVPKMKSKVFFHKFNAPIFLKLHLYLYVYNQVYE